MQTPLALPGCRHDILGHYLKAIGLLRVLAKCADQEHCDPEAEGWWDLERACFCLRAPKYPTKEKLVEFFAKHYQPTPFFSSWNTGGGLNEKKEIEFSIAQTSWNEFWANNRDVIVPLIAEAEKREAAVAGLNLRTDAIKFTLSGTAPRVDAASRHFRGVRGDEGQETETLFGTILVRNRKGPVFRAIDCSPTCSRGNRQIH